MTWPALVQYVIFLILVSLLVAPAGRYLERVFTNGATIFDPVLRPVERAIYRVSGVNAEREMDWKEYAGAFVRFGALGAVLLYLILRVQEHLPWWQSAYLTTEMTPNLAANTAVSFSTGTTWQAYAGETTMSYFSQMVGLTAQNFLAGAAGLSIGMAFIRGLARHDTARLGNFWVDLVRSLLWVLLPVSIVGALVLVWQGVPANLDSFTSVHTLSGETQVIAQGPVASLEFVKSFGSNGGGFFSVNSAHPFENPTPLTNLIEMLAIIVVPAALTHTFGRMTGNTRHGWLLYSVMIGIFVSGLVIAGWAEQNGNPLLTEAGAHQETMLNGANSAGGNMEGKEVRFGVGGSVLAAITTSNGATGSYNSMHDSYTPLGGAIPLVNMLLGEMVFGGLGTGIFSIVIVALLGIFLCGLMVGRTPEYLGKRLTPVETKPIVIYMLIGSVSILIPTAIALATPQGVAGLTTNTGAHGLSEIVVAFASAFANNGQSFAGLSANSPFYNYATALVMLAGRIGLGVTALYLAGTFAAQGRRQPSVGAFPVNSLLFALVIVGTAILVVLLSYAPALALGPIFEDRLMRAGS